MYVSVIGLAHMLPYNAAVMVTSVDQLWIENLYLKRVTRVICTALSIRLGSGDMLEIRGANGAGKTSLLRVIAGLATAQNGRVLWNGHDVPQAEYAAAMSYFGHLNGLHSQLTPSENLRFYYRLKHQYYNNSRNLWALFKNGARRIDMALDYFGLRDCSDVPCHCLSRGQLQRVGLSRLLIEPGTVWLLDEPAAALDQVGVGLLEKIISQHLYSGGIAVVSTHRRLHPPAASAKHLLLPALT